MKIRGTNVVITGASTGIGRALAVELGRAGASVIVTARSRDRLGETSALLSAYAIPHECLELDITSEKSRGAFIQHFAGRAHPIDIFVNNAGIGLFEDTLRSTAHDMQAVFATNFWGPLELLQKIVPLMQGGLVVNLSSAAAKYAPYQQGIYAASKAALERITEAIDVEARVRTLLVIPDRTDTPFMRNVVGPRENARLALALAFASPEMVAKKIVRAIRADARICYPTLKSYVYAMLSAATPWLVRKIIMKSIP